MRRHAFAALCAACALTVGIPGLLTLALAAEREPGPPAVRNVSDVAVSVDAETLHRQYTALSSMPSVKVAYSALGPVRSMEGATGVVISARARSFKKGDDASEVLQKFKDVLLATGTEALKVRVNRMTAGRRTIRMEQSINGIPVLYGSVSVGIDDSTGLVTMLSATFLPDRGLPRQPKLSEADAAKRLAQLLVERGMAKPGSVATSAASLAYTGTHPDSTRGHLVWAVPARFTPVDVGATDGIFWIDAVDGELVGSDALSRQNLKVHTGNNTAPPPENFPTNLTLLFNHPGSSADPIAMNAYNNLLDSLQATQVIGGWVQIDPLHLIVHWAANNKKAAMATLTPALSEWSNIVTMFPWPQCP